MKGTASRASLSMRSSDDALASTGGRWQGGSGCAGARGGAERRRQDEVRRYAAAAGGYRRPARTLPIGRVVGPEDVAALAVHIITNTALTGTTYDIDGGRQFVF